MNSTPKSERFYIGIFGRCNNGKSSLINALTNQKVSVVSPKKGTTTDNVLKAIELNNLGPCVFVDTPGFDNNENVKNMLCLKLKEIENKKQDYYF